jgi:hypothetical protein
MFRYVPGLRPDPLSYAPIFGQGFPEVTVVAGERITADVAFFTYT